MKRNEYDSAEVLEIGKAEKMILGQKTSEMDLDSSGGEPMDRHYLAFASTEE
jgi:hypothetical protein